MQPGWNQYSDVGSCVVYVCVHLSVKESQPSVKALPIVYSPRRRGSAAGRAPEGGFLRVCWSCLSRAPRFREPSGGCSAPRPPVWPAGFSDRSARLCWHLWEGGFHLWWHIGIIWGALQITIDSIPPQEAWSKTWASGVLKYPQVILMSQSGLLRHVSESPGEAFTALSAWVPLLEILMLMSVLGQSSGFFCVL